MKTPPTQYDFEEPASINDAEQRRAVLLEQISDINLQLNDPNKVDPESGQRMSGASYREWRHRASFARGIKQAEYNWLGRWIKAFNMEARETALARAVADPESCEGLLRGMYDMVKGMVSLDDSSPRLPVELFEEEQALLDQVGLYLRGKI